MRSGIQWQRPARRGEAGLTLVEMIIVVAIVGILAAMLSLGIRQIRASWALRQAATTAASELNRARSNAIAESVVYVVAFVPGVPGDPGRVLIYRPGLQVGGTVSVSSNGTDNRTVIVTGRTGNELVSETLTLDDATSKPGTQSFDWILEALVTIVSPIRTVTLTGGGSFVTIGPTQSIATMPWALVRSVAAPEWPASVTVSDDGTTFDACPALPPAGPGGSSRCALFSPSGEPIQSSADPIQSPGDPGPCASFSSQRCRIRLVSEVGRVLYVAVEPTTGRVSVERE